jgi:glycosyltransferase involved in cell wall biosynthesis
MSREPERAPALAERGPLTASEPLNVIVINDSATISGGADKVALAEAVGLARLGHQVTLIAGHGEPDRELADAGVTVRTTGQPTTLGDPSRLRAGARGIWNRASAALVREVLHASDPSDTVVHVHGFVKVLSASVIRAAVQSGLTTVATLHDYFVACPNGAFFNYPRGEICELTPLSARCVATNCDARAYSHKLWRVGRSAVQRRFGAMPSGVGDFIAPTHLAADIMRPFLPEDARMHVLANPVDAERMPPVDPSRNAAFVCVARLQPDKGPVLFARAARKAGVPAVFVGAGEEADAVRRAYPDAVLTGWLDPDRVQAELRGARAAVSASLWYETQGLTTLEAAAHGVPAIVPDVSVAREAVADGVSGLWFRSGDVDDLAEKLARLGQQPELASSLGRAAYERFWSGEWDLGDHLGRLEAIYRGALNVDAGS